MKKVSILLLTINRYHLTKEYVGQALSQAGYPYELCITDNGSTDPLIFDWCEKQNPKIYNKNAENQGTAQSLNRMIDQNSSDYYVFIGNDIQLPNNWLKILIDHAEAIPNSGVLGYNWRGNEKDYPIINLNGKEVMSTTNTFGTTFVSQLVRDKVGKFCEDYGVYGLWDSDYHFRVRKAGFENYYIKGMSSHHFGNDVGENTPYRKMKDESASKAKPKFSENMLKYEKGEIYI